MFSYKLKKTNCVTSPKKIWKIHSSLVVCIALNIKCISQSRILTSATIYHSNRIDITSTPTAKLESLENWRESLTDNPHRQEGELHSRPQPADSNHLACEATVLTTAPQCRSCQQYCLFKLPSFSQWGEAVRIILSSLSTATMPSSCSVTIP